MILKEEWRPADGLTLEPGALRAVKEEVRSVMLIAGPGTGKTEMLAQRADFLLRTGVSCYPKRILAISFKVDASTNLKERVSKRCGYELSSRFDSYTFAAFAKFLIDRYRCVLVGNNALDWDYVIGKKRNVPKEITFKDLLPLAILIVKNSSQARNLLQQTYSDVFLDEFQDCTKEQYEFVKLAFHNTGARLVAVGDSKQKIMVWAGAFEGVFNSFKKDFNALELRIYRNFRSKPRLLRVQNSIIKSLDPEAAMLESDIQGDEGEVYIEEFADERDEAKALVALIEKWNKEDRVPLSEIAVLISQKVEDHAKELMNELRNHQIPYRNENELQDITVEPLARLIVDFLSCVYVERSPDSWERLNGMLAPFMSEENPKIKQESLYLFLQKKEIEVIKNKHTSISLNQWKLDAKEFIIFIGKEVCASLAPGYDSLERFRQVYRETISKIEKLNELTNDLRMSLLLFSGNEQIKILTIHKSKGLEFDNVIIVGVEEEVFRDGKDDSRCVFFVGVTRARRRLVLTYAKNRTFSNRCVVDRKPKTQFLSYVLPHVSGEKI